MYIAKGKVTFRISALLPKVSYNNSCTHIYVYIYNPTPRNALSVPPSVTEKYRIVYCQCIYKANIIPNVRCAQDDDDHHHLFTMRSSS